MTRAPKTCAYALFCALSSLLACVGVFVPMRARAAGVVTSNYTLIDMSGGTNFTTNGNAQTGWQVTNGTANGTIASVNSAHWDNASFYYFGYMVNKSYTYNPVTGVWGNTNNANATHGYLSSAADVVTVTVSFPQATNIGMMRFYPGGYVSPNYGVTFSTDYSVSYQDGTNWVSLISPQTVLQSDPARSQQAFRDNTFATVSAQNWRIVLSNGDANTLNGNATFGEVQFFTAAQGDTFWAPAAGGGGSGTWSSNSASWGSAGGQQGSSNQASLGTLVFGNNAGTVTVNGTVSAAAGMKFATDGYVVTGGTAVTLAGDSPTMNTITVDSGVGTTINSVLAGTNGMNKEGSGTLTLGGTNTYTGGTVVSAGLLVGDTASIRGAMTNNAEVVFNQGTNGTFSNAISGDGLLTKSGNATLTLSGSNTYTGGTLVSAGRLSGSTTSLQGAITNNAELAFSQTNTGTNSGLISGSGALFKSGSGTVVMSANSTYSGATTVEAGRLAVTGTNTNSAVTVNSGASVGGSGKIGSLTVNGTVAPGNSVGTLNAGGTVFSAAGAYDLEMFNWSNSAGTGWDLLAITGNLTLSNTIDNPFAVNLISMSSSTARGLSTNFNSNKNFTNTFVTYSGSLVGTEFNQNLFSVNTGSFSNVFTGAFRVTTNTGGLALVYLANFDPTAPYSWTNGPGNWSLDAGWTNSAPPTNGAAVIIKGGVSVMTNNGVVSSISSLTFSNTTSSATIGGSALTIGTNGIINLSTNAHTVNVALIMTGATTINAASNNITLGTSGLNNGGNLLTVTGAANTTINGAITNTGGLAKEGSGTLTLGGIANSYSGGTIVTGGRLVGDSTSIRGLVTNNAAVTFNQSTNGTFSNVMSGTGSLLKTGSAILTLSGANTYSGGTEIAAGQLSGDTTSLRGLITNNASLRFNQTTNGTFSDTIVGTGMLTKIGAASLTLSGISTYSGTTLASAGTLVVDGSITNSSVTVQSGGTLAGSGSVGGIVLNTGGTISPGNSPGTLNVTGNVTWNPDANYNWQIYNATGAAGSTNGWDFLNVTGSLNLSNLSVGSEFNINLWSLSGISPDTNGSAVNFNPNQNYTWTILTAAGGIGGFDPSYFKVNVFATNGTGGFLNSLAGGAFSMGVSGNSLNLLFTSAGPAGVPEPGTWAAAVLVAGGAAFVRWRRRGQKSS
ncbi:MAG: beta strand repeat-containing protein [Chthoniobacterales bacterium]